MAAFPALFVPLAVPSLQAQVNDELVKQQEDARLYLEMIDILKDATLDDQIAGWEKFLRDHSDSYFKDEIQGNLDNMKARRSIQEKAREEEDSRLYFKTVEQAASLALPEQIKLWERYLKDNSDSLFANEARTTLNRLREEQRWGGGEARAAPLPPPVASAAPTGATRPLPTPAPTVTLPSPAPAAVAKNAAPVDLNASASPEYLDPDRAFFLAAVPGIVVPGLGHFYAKRYAMGGFLAAMRIVGLGLLGIGAYRNNTILVAPGVLLTLVSYGLDVLMAPIEARNYNYSLNPLPPLEDGQVPESFYMPYEDNDSNSLADLKLSAQLTWRF